MGKIMVNKNIILLLSLILSYSTIVFCQTQQASSVIHNVHQINSQVLGEERTILVRLPASYNQSESKFSVIYMLNAHPPHNAMIAGIIDQAWGQKNAGNDNCRVSKHQSNSRFNSDQN